MQTANRKYRPYAPVALRDRTWPDAVIASPPMWCSVDLRDGNQALIEPMGTERKLRLWKTLVAMGFKEIEVGFPAASQTDFDFVRHLIEGGLIPDDVTIQVLTQSRPEIITRTMESIRGARRAIVHLYNSTSELQRRVVFRADKPEIVRIAVEGAKLIEALKQDLAGITEVVHQYSPESFTGTELEFAREICEAVMDVHRPTPDHTMILNLPATVEMSTPNVHADQIEWFCRNVKDREAVIISLHPHNDRGTAVAATELGLMAGADRVEGTLFGNGERTGNVDIVTLALNLYSQGIDPGLKIGDINELIRTAEYCTQLPIHPRHPYAGELVFTAFSGSHQDAINKGLKALEAAGQEHWEVPYLPIDPKDLGRSYEAVIRINSQSGKGGIAYVMEREYGLELPRRLQIEFGRVVQGVADGEGVELSAERLYEAFRAEYLFDGRIGFVSHRTEAENGEEERKVEAVIEDGGARVALAGHGTGPIDGFTAALQAHLGWTFQLVDYREHAIGTGANAAAVAYVELRVNDKPVFGVGMDRNIVVASLKAVVSAVNRAIRDGLA